LLASVALASAVGFVLVPTVGDRYLSLIGSLDYRRLSTAVLALLLALSFALAGPVGVGIFAVATVVGLLPPRFGSRRATLMGVLLVPLAVG
jgi:putative membrane protein